MKPLLLAVMTVSAFTAACQPTRKPTSEASADGLGSNQPTIKCTGGAAFYLFEATLDGSSYEAGSGFFDVTNASIEDGYATAQLLCTGHELGEIDCIGFWFNSAASVVEVTSSQEHGLSITFKSLRGDEVADDVTPWPCVVTEPKQ